MKTFLGIDSELEQYNKTIKPHLDNYVHEMLTEYKDYTKKSLLPKRVPISQVPDPPKPRYYRSSVAKLQFASSWIRFDISLVVSQLARFCASAGASHWSAIPHLMEYLEGFPCLELTYPPYRRSRRATSRIVP